MSTDPYDPSGEFRDDRPQQGTLDTADPTQHRESRIDEPRATEFGVDDRPDEERDDDGKQFALVTDADDGQQALDGGSAAGRSLWDDPDSEDTLMDRLARSARRLRKVALEPLPEPEEAMITDTGIDKRELEGTGLEPGDFEIIDGIMPLAAAEEAGYHPSDGEDPFHDDADDEAEIGANLAASVEEVTDEIYDPTEEGSESAEGDESTEPQPEPEPEPTATTEIEFDRRDSANHFRDEHPNHLAESDDRRTKVVVVREDAPEDVIDEAAAQAAESRAHKAEQFGQAELTKAELRDLRGRDRWGPHKRFHAQSAKAILLGKGVEDWLAYYDVRATTDEHREIAENALETGGGSEARPDADDREGVEDARLASVQQTAESETCDHAHKGCEDGHDEACDVLLAECGYDENEITAIKDDLALIDEDPSLFDALDDAPDPDAARKAFDEWAARVEPTIPEIDESELAAIAPTPEAEQTGEQELSGRVYGALRKAWGGYRASLADARDARDEARHYAEVINGIRVVHGQEPIDFDGMDGFGGQVVSDDPDEMYPAGESGSRRLGDCSIHRSEGVERRGRSVRPDRGGDIDVRGVHRLARSRRGRACDAFAEGLARRCPTGSSEETR